MIKGIVAAGLACVSALVCSGCAANSTLTAFGDRGTVDRTSVHRQSIMSVGDCVRPCVRAEYTIPTSNSGPTIITLGPDGNLWFTEQTAQQIAKITNEGVITEYPVNAVPGDITSGPDGNIWFTSIALDGGIGKMTTGGLTTLYPMGTDPRGIAAGPDGNIWFTGQKCKRYGRGLKCVSSVYKLSTAGVILARYRVATGLLTGADRITTGPDEKLWFTEWGGFQIGRITSSGDVKKFSGPLDSAFDKGIAAGTDGKLWFTDPGNDEVGKISVHGAISEYSAPTAGAFPTMIAAGSDSMWFTEQDADKIGRITPSGVVTEFSIPTASSGPIGIARGSDGNIWFTEKSANKIGMLVP
jgi:streptogramin lyase